MLVEQLAVQPLSTTSQTLLDQALTADHTAVLETERRRLAQRIQEQIIEPLNLLLSQTTAYHQSLMANPQAKMALSVLTTLVRQALQQTRDLEGDLHPAVLESLGLEPALEVFTNQIVRTYGIQVTLQLERLAERLAPTLELLIFRTTQEIIEQVIHYGRASHITLQLQLKETQLVYQLTDNGLADRPPLSPIMTAQLAQVGGTINGQFQPNTGYVWLIVFQRKPAIELTPRELETVQLLAQGLSNKEIAARMSVTPRTINYHLDNIYSKLGVNSRTEAAVIALQKGWVT
jgi:DNA-binding NarL/FixJ family response regulator